MANFINAVSVVLLTTTSACVTNQHNVQTRRCNANQVVTIPAGRYLIGCGVTRQCYPPNDPIVLKGKQFELERWQWVASFEIERAEATEGDFYGCKCGTDCERDPASFATLDRPSDEFTYEAAETHCRNKGMRLPTNAEWEAAAGGPLHFEYSWGPTIVDTTMLKPAWVHIGLSDVGKAVYPPPIVERSPFGTTGMSGGAPEFVVSDTGLAKGASTIEQFGDTRFKVYFGQSTPFAGVRCAK